MSANSYKESYKTNLTQAKKKLASTGFRLEFTSAGKNSKQMLLHMTNLSDLGKTTHVLLFFFHPA